MSTFDSHECGSIDRSIGRSAFPTCGPVLTMDESVRMSYDLRPVVDIGNCRRLGSDRRAGRGVRARALNVAAPFTQHRDYCCLSHAPLLASDDIVLDDWWFSSAKRKRRGASIPCKSPAMARRYLSTFSCDSDAIWGPEFGDDAFSGRTSIRNSAAPSVSSRADCPEGTRDANSVGEETRETGELCHG